MQLKASFEKSAQLFQHLFEESSLGIAVEDLDGRLLLANPALCSMLGFQQEELCAMSCSEFANEEDSRDDWELFQKLRAGLIDRYSLEKRYVRKDGVQIWGRLNVALWKGAHAEDSLVFAFVEDVTDRKRAEETLLASESRLQLATQAGKMYAFEWDVATDLVVRSSEHVNILGWTDPISVTREQFLDRIHPDDRAKFSESVADLTPEKPTKQLAYRVMRPDGVVIWLDVRMRAFFDPKGKMLRVIGMSADVTSGKQAEEALSQVSRKLIEAQEKERNRIGRELHDDIGQRLALLTVELQQLNQTVPDSAVALCSRLGELQKQATEISTDVQALSHEMHSAKLEYLGIVAAMRSFCQEFGEQRRMEIGFRSHDLPRTLPSPEVSLCLFRVLQEALHNAAKHSGVRHFEVRLWGTLAEIHLLVSDSGAGFDTEATREGRGLGLTSMEERLKLVNGELSVESHLKGGTKIYARVPLSADSQSELAG